MKGLYINALHGASGDMILSSLLDYGLPISFLENVIDRLSIKNVTLEMTKSTRKGVKGTHLDVIIDPSSISRYTWKDFVSAVNNSDFSNDVKSTATDIFKLIGKVESMVHEVDIDEVHLHELGTVDTLVDVVGVIASIEELGIDKVYCSSLPMGSGLMNSSHGILTVPPPATLKILEIMKIPSFSPGPTQSPTGEMLTPTGASILGTISNFESPVIEISGSGCGLGTRDSDSYPNVTTIHIGNIDTARGINGVRSSSLVLLETNIDDTSGEILGYVFERLLNMGVKDVWHTPIQMKKNRPATLMSVLINNRDLTEISNFIFRETTTLGIRVRDINRLEADRRIEKFQSSLGIVDVKVKVSEGLLISISPEYEDCKEIALNQKMILADVYNIIQTEIRDKFFK